MRLSRAFIPTLKEIPADAQVVSHQLLLRAGFIRQLGAGIYSYLPLAQRSLKKVERIVREEMDAIGAQEFFLPALHPAEIWKESGRWEVMGDNMFRLKDRKGGDYCLGMTHEEIFTSIARSEIRSYRELPQTWYQIQTKFRDEPRPKSGLLRVRQFTMKDSYSFDVDQAGLDVAFEKHRVAYHRVYSRCGLAFAAVDAHSGAMGGSKSTEFMVRTDAGEDNIAYCPSCDYAANVEKATSRVGLIADGPGLPAPEKFATPGVRTILDLEQPPYHVEAKRQLKTLVFVADGRTVIAVVRGDQEMHEAKLQTATGAQEIRPASVDEIVALLGARPGSLGAVGTSGKEVYLDTSLVGRKDMVTGANEDDHHLRGVDVDRDLAHARLADLRTVQASEGCPSCPGEIQVWKGLEVGHIFKLGTRYSESMGATVLGPDGKSTPIVMGSYGIGVERIMAAAIELHHDENGIVWPMSIAPYQVSLVALQMNDAAVVEAAEKLYAELGAAGIEVLFDDRDERAGVKFKDADLVGLPIRIAVGKKALAEGKVEWKLRRGGEVELVSVGEIAAKVRATVAELTPAAVEPRR
ncbi:proline--tRNA ligase [Vulgatibacter incomptus]|uniref:Proline--tRNA ligase n=1 Tax=Vulgatibacter incomptus TaxID=1391653 RepID=A0A0K1PCU0_9BACT|nr:proline--tRNA ligase [Vulgatibacter incomptus]AKU91340.1 Prolyl-tRNA synthetase [Vulgatibacter incomptus]